MGVYSRFCRYPNPVLDEHDGTLIHGDIVFDPPFSLLSADQQGEPFYSFQTRRFREMILEIARIDICPGYDSEDWTGVSTIDQVTVRLIANKLVEFFGVNTPNFEGESHRLATLQNTDIARVFRDYARAGYMLVSS